MEIISLLTSIGLLIISALMLKSWLPRQTAPGWYSAVFCAALLMGCYSISDLSQQLLQIDLAASWLQQLAWYAGAPLLAFVSLALAFNIDWPKEAWGRILLGVCGIYWLAQQGQVLEYLLPAAFGLCLAAQLKSQSSRLTDPLELYVLILMLSALVISIPGTAFSMPAVAILAGFIGCHLGFTKQAKSLS